MEKWVMEYIAEEGLWELGPKFVLIWCTLDAEVNDEI